MLDNRVLKSEFKLGINKKEALENYDKKPRSL